MSFANCVIEADELQNLDGDYKLFDCRFSLVDPEQPRTEFARGHIPGAQFLDLEVVLSDHAITGRGRHPLPDCEKFIRNIRALGVSCDSTIILYDESFVAASARAWWMLHVTGHRHVRLLNGGLQGWLKQGYPLQKGEAASVAAVACDNEQVTDWPNLVHAHQIPVALQQGIHLLDARDPARFRGETETVDPVAGHIPGAQCFWFREICDAEGYIKPVSEQRARWQEIVNSSDTIFYCGSGVTACVNIFSWCLAGRPLPKLYPGGWSEWCRRNQG